MITATKLGVEVIKTLHYEITDVFNNPLPPIVSVPATTPGWTELPPSQSVFHDNGIGLPERKFIHVDGREAIYDGDTGLIVDDPELRGTYNYINAAPISYWYDGPGWVIFVGRGAGHFAVDVIPYLILGNDRPGEGEHEHPPQNGNNNSPGSGEIDGP